MSEHRDFVNEAFNVFATTENAPEIVYEITFDKWFAWLRVRLRSSIWPEALVTCKCCDGLGCPKCLLTGKHQLGASNEEEEVTEIATRLLLHSRYHCPPERLPWMDLAIDIFCDRWAVVVQQNKPPF